MCQDVRKPRESKNKYPYEDEMLPVWCAPIVLGVAILLFYATYKIYNDLPQALQSENQVRSTYQGIFLKNSDQYGSAFREIILIDS